MESESRYNLLLIDDNPTNLRLLRELIQQHLPECLVFEAGNGTDGLELACNQAIHGAFIDMQMPGMDGIEVCRRLKADERTASMPVVLITAHQSSPELRAEGLDAGAYDFISQPIRNVEMVARIRALLRLRAVENRLQRDNQGLRKQIEQKTAALRWISGLISAGDGNLQQTAPEALQQLLELLNDEGELNFDLFRGELFRRFPGNLKRTLLRLSLLDSIPVRLAERLAEIENVSEALAYLERHNFFVQYFPQ
jgi:LuxR family transcriptional regulator, maltose regulon positive regulatory protein